MNFKCNADYVYKIPNHIAPTIKEKADIWKKCAPSKARSILLAFFIVATIIIVIYTYKYKNVIHSLIGVGIALLVGILIYNISISNTEYDSEEMLNLYAIALSNNKDITVNEFVKDMEIRTLTRQLQQQQQQLRRQYKTGGNPEEETCAIR